MERPLKRIALDGTAILSSIPLDVWNYIASSFLSASDRAELRIVSRFFHSVCWRRGAIMKWTDALNNKYFHDEFNFWPYITGLIGVEAASPEARDLLGRCSSLTSISFASADHHPSSTIWLPPATSFEKLSTISFQLDDCLTGELGSWASGFTSLTSVELVGDDGSSCSSWKSLAAQSVSNRADAIFVDASEDEDDSCSSLEEVQANQNLASLPLNALSLSVMNQMGEHKFIALGNSLASRLTRLDLRLGCADSPLPYPEVGTLSMLTNLRVLTIPDVVEAGKLRLPHFVSLETLLLRLHDTGFSLTCVSTIYTLRSLSIISTFSGPRNMPDKINALRCLTALTELNISHSAEEVDSERIRLRELQCLTALTVLTHLKLRANVEPHAAGDLSHVPHFPQLSCLELSYCDLRVFVLEADWLPLSRYAASLTKLKLKGAVFSTDAEDGFAATLARLPLLCTLHLEVHDRWTCEALRDALARLAHLHLLSFGVLRSLQLSTLLPSLASLHSFSFWPHTGQPAVDLYSALPSLRYLSFHPLTTWIELTPHPFVLLRRIPEACFTLFYNYGYLRQSEYAKDARAAPVGL